MSEQEAPHSQAGAIRSGAGALVVVPTFNEAENIEAILKAVAAAAPEAGVLVVDDGSPDGTAALVDQAAAADGRIHLLRGQGKAGLGAAYVRGFNWGLAAGYQRFVEMDADFSHDPGTIPDLLATTETCDVAIGSRYMPGGGVVGWSKGRHALSMGGNLYSRIALGFGVRDSTSGFRCYRARVLNAIDLPSVRSNGYAFQIDMTYRSWRLGYRICEIPITFRERSLGASKMSKSIVSEALMAVAGWGARDLVRRQRRPGTPPSSDG
ncbi:MAG TPA: polyprenol monophosphomannose synthase [Actinomycetota bacterium]|nr:polyprenol monophosphomannose synthase [Actinomycetota bacterium]